MHFCHTNLHDPLIKDDKQNNMCKFSLSCMGFDAKTIPNTKFQFHRKTYEKAKLVTFPIPMRQDLPFPFNHTSDLDSHFHLESVIPPSFCFPLLFFSSVSSTKPVNSLTNLTWGLNPTTPFLSFICLHSPLTFPPNSHIKHYFRK